MSNKNQKAGKFRLSLWSLGQSIPFTKNKVKDDVTRHFEADGGNDETFFLKDLEDKFVLGMNVYVSPDALFHKSDSLFVNGNGEAAFRRSAQRTILLVKSHDGFTAENLSGGCLDIASPKNEDMPDIFYWIENNNKT